MTEARPGGLVFNTVTAESSVAIVQAGRDVHFHEPQSQSRLGRTRVAAALGVVALTFLVTPEPLDKRPTVVPAPMTIAAKPTTSAAPPTPTPTRTSTPPPAPAPTTSTTTTTVTTPSTRPAVEPTGPVVEVSIGEPESSDSCAEPCHAMRVRMRGFPPHAQFKVVPHSSEWDSPFNPGVTLHVNADGTEDFHHFRLPPKDHYVWAVVTIDGRKHESNRYRWPIH